MPRPLDVPGIAFTVLRTDSLRHAGFGGAALVLGFRKRSLVPCPDCRVRLGKCFPSVERITVRVCLLVVLDVLSVFQSPRFNSFFGGKTFFLGAYSYIPHSGFLKVL